MPFADDLWIWPIPGGPGGRLGLGQYTAVYSVWKFAKNREAAERFVADVCLGGERGDRPRPTSSTSRASRAPTR